MANKKVTIRDVAKEAGVSVATVSYVVNGRTDLKISDETRKRVLQVINLLNYSPNQAAKALASKRKNQVGFAISDTDSVLKAADEMQVMKAVTKYLLVLKTTGRQMHLSATIQIKALFLQLAIVTLHLYLHWTATSMIRFSSKLTRIWID